MSESTRVSRRKAHEELRSDRRSESRLILEALWALAIVIGIVWIREVFFV